MKQGYGVFGRAYEVMLRSDLHAPGSIDHKLMERMILLEEDSLPLLYGGVPAVNPAMKEHALYPFTRQFVGKSAAETIDNLLSLTAGIAQSCDLPFEQMRFGGTEQQILQRVKNECPMFLWVPQHICHLALVLVVQPDLQSPRERVCYRYYNVPLPSKMPASVVPCPAASS